LSITTCSFVEIEGEINDEFQVVHLGLLSWKPVNAEACQVYKDHPWGRLKDASWKCSLAFSIITLVLGFTSSVLLLVSTCKSLRPPTWRRIALGLIFASIFEGLKFVFLTSEICWKLFHCSLSQNSWSCIAASVGWFVSSLSLVKIPAPKASENFNHNAMTTNSMVIDNIPNGIKVTSVDLVPQPSVNDAA